MWKTSNPYGANFNVLVPPETIEKERRKDSGKFRARYPDTPLGPSQANGEAGKMKRPAYTPGTTPAGS